MPYYSVNHIKIGIFRADENCGFHPCDDNEKIANKLWPIIKGIIMTAIENKQNLILEGCYLFPEFLNEMEDDYKDEIIPVFFGFTESYIKT